MKKIFVLLLTMMLVGCSEPKEENEISHVYQDGTYTTNAFGYGGEFQVETTIKDDQIVDIIVGEHNETPSIGGVAIEQIIDTMKKNNTYDVDIVSGATKTSQAMKDAVSSAYQKAKNKAE